MIFNNKKNNIPFNNTNNNNIINNRFNNNINENKIFENKSCQTSFTEEENSQIQNLNVIIQEQTKNIQTLQNKVNSLEMLLGRVNNLIEKQEDETSISEDNNINNNNNNNNHNDNK